MYYIGVDLGTSAVKLLLMEGNGKICNIVSNEYPLSFPQPGWSEQKPEDWWDAVVDGIKKLVDGFDASEVAGISFGGQMHGLVILDENDNVIRPVGSIRLDKEEIEFDDVNKGDNPVFEILVANTSNKAYSPVLMHLPPYLTAKAVPEVLGRGKNGRIEVTLDSEKLPKLGITRTSVYLARFPGDKVGSENEIPVSVALLPDFSHESEWVKNNPPVLTLSATSLEFPPLNPKQKKSQNIIITNTGKSDLTIQDMQVLNIALAVRLKKRVLKPGESTKMKITVLAENLPRVKGTPRVLMLTNDPKHPKVTIRVKATVKK